MDGFKQLLQTIRDCTKKSDKIKVGLEATGHYSYNILGFLLDNDLAVYVMNPLHTNLYRKSLSLRKTKTDRVDARTIATMLLSDVDLKSYTDGLVVHGFLHQGREGSGQFIGLLPAHADGQRPLRVGVHQQDFLALHCQSNA